MKKRSILILIVLIIIILSAVLYIYIVKPGPSDENSAASLYVPEEPGIAVEAVRAESGVVIPSIKSSGLIRGKNEAVIISETRGVIENVYANIGAFLEEGDSILSVDSNVAELSMLQAEQQFRSAQIDYNAVKRAYDSGSASEAEMLRAQSQLAGAEAQYRDAGNRFENAVVKAPFAGYLADIESSLSIGNYISEGTRIGRVIDISSVRVDLFLGNDEIGRIKTGAPAVIEAGGRSLEGRVEAIALSSDRNTGSFRVIVEAENPYGVEMRSGFPADVIIREVDSSESIIIPASSMLEIGGANWVYVIEDEKASLRKVEAGLVSGNRQEVVSGLTEGEAVIATGLKSMSDGAEVIPSFVSAEGGGR